MQALRDGIDLSQLLFGEDKGGQAVVRAFEQQITDLLTLMLQATSIEELAANQNQAVGILKGLERMGGSIQQIRLRVAEKASKKVVKQALSLHETLD